MKKKITNGMYFILHANCMLVRGKTQSTISDIYRGRYKIIPNLLYNILIEMKDNSVVEILRKYSSEQKGIKIYLNLLLSDDWGILTDTPELFIPIEENWESYSVITNAIIDYNFGSDYDIHNLLIQLNDLGCSAVQLRYYGSADLTIIKKFFELLVYTSFEFVEIIIKYDINIVNEITQYNIKIPRVQQVIFYSSPFDKEELIHDNTNYFSKHVYKNDEIRDNSCCGNISPSLFTINLPFWMEGINHNNCLNRKIGIDVNGNIKNCPSSSKYFGNIKSNKISEVLKNQEFTSIWDISKSLIEECKECEFRMICPDCRIFIKDNENLYSKPSKCNYNPSTGKWENQ